jgi:hypothetical protein
LCDGSWLQSLRNRVALLLVSGDLQTHLLSFHHHHHHVTQSSHLLSFVMSVGDSN